VRLAGSTLTFSRAPLSVALEGLARLGFRYVELAAHEGWAHIGPARLAADVAAGVAEVRRALAEAGLQAVALNAGLGRADPGEQRRRAAALARLAAEVGAVVLTVPAAPSPRGEETFAAAGAEIARLEGLLGAVRPYGVVLAVEGHLGTLTEHPATAAALCRAVPGLKLTLDPSHYWAGPAGGRGWEEVLPFVAHVHLRDAGRGGWAEIQVAPGRGQVDFPAVLAALRAAGYDGACAVEYIDTLPVAGGTGAAEAAAEMARLARSWGLEP
jgi:sugar phosphate isomerase/epimerase